MRRLACLALLLFAEPAGADALLSVSPKESKLTYHLVHKLHRFDGTSTQLEGKAKLLPNGDAQVMVRASVESFDSGNTNRDAHMKETVEAARYPTVELKALVPGAAPPAARPAVVERRARAALSFHGVTQELELPVTLTFEADGKIRAAAHLELSLEAYKIDRPSLMFVKIDDAMRVDAELVFAP